MIRTRWALVGFLAVALCTVAAGADGPGVAERRAQVGQAAALGAEGLPALQAALDDPSALVCRAAVRALVQMGDGAQGALEAALGNRDPVVRRAALLALAGDPSPGGVARIARGIDDADALVREAAVQWLVEVTPASDEVVALLRRVENDASPEIQAAALTALAALAPAAGAFHPPARDVVLLRQRPDMVDHVASIVAAATVPLPREGWRFRVDPAGEGHVQRWFEPAYDDARWNDMQIETAWMAGYTGVGWYRRTIDLPARPEHLAAEMVFGGVDECAWVWVNGVYVGGQDIGPEGWNQPFRVDVTRELRWGEPNQITVRVLNSAAAGGIWRPVRIEALTLKR